MKTIFLVLLYFGVTSTVIASEFGTLVSPVSFCEKRSDAYAMSVFTIMNSDKMDNTALAREVKKSGCVYLAKKVRLKVYKMTKEAKLGAEFHYANVSLEADNTNTKFWVSYIFDPKNNVHFLDLDNGDKW